MAPGDNIAAPLSKQLDVHVLKTVGSTNTWLLDGNFPAAITLCAAEHQTVGRGRRGKTWHSPDSGLTFSMRFNLSEPVSRFSGLSLLVGSVLCDCLRAVSVSEARVKWPNDVLVQEAKLAGILIESRTGAPDAESIIVIGIGVNYQRGAEARLIDQANTDLASICGTDFLPDRSELIANIAGRLIPLLSHNVPAAVASLSARWADYDALAGVEVTATVAGESLDGRAAGIDENGGLRVLINGAMRVFNSADVTVRKHI